MNGRLNIRELPLRTRDLTDDTMIIVADMVADRRGGPSVARTPQTRVPILRLATFLDQASLRNSPFLVAVADAGLENARTLQGVGGITVTDQGDGATVDIDGTGLASSAAWGGITGTLSAQTDLQSALDAKAALTHTHVEADITDLQAYALSSALTAHTGDGTIHFTEASILHNNIGGIGASDHHTRYADSEAVAAMGVLGDTNPLNHSRYTDAAAAAAAPVQTVFGRSGAVVPVVNDYAWSDIDKTVSDLADLTTRSHASLTSIGTNSHASLDAHLASGANPHTVTAAQAGAQPLDSTLTSLAALGTAADKLAYTTGIDTWAEAALTAAGRALLDDADAAVQRATLGLVIGTDVQAWNVTLDGWAGRAIPNGVVVGTSDIQTLLNKTLPSPLLTDPVTQGLVSPTVDAVDDLGSTSKRYRDLWISRNLQMKLDQKLFFDEDQSAYIQNTEGIGLDVFRMFGSFNTELGTTSGLANQRQIWTTAGVSNCEWWFRKITTAIFAVRTDGHAALNDWANRGNGQFAVRQEDTAGGIPVLRLDQQDISEGVIDFIASARGSGTTAATDIQDTVRVELNGTIYRLALYTDA